MRPFLVLLLCSATAVLSAEVVTTRVWPEYRSADSFERIGEFFTGREVSGRETILRSQGDERAGFYFLARLKNGDAPMDSVKVELRVITPDSPSEKIFTDFAPFTLRKGSQVIHVGLTGKDWPSEVTQPVAWQLRFLDASGNELTREASFLWGQPR